MSVEDRLFTLLTQARQSGGVALLYDAAALRAQLSAQAPDLHGEIQALAAAIRMGAAAKANGGPDPLRERANIAADIARAERLSLTVVQPAVEAACRSGIAPPPAAPAGLTNDAWIGDSIMPGAAAAPPPPPRSSQPRSYPPRPTPVYHAPPVYAGPAAAPAAPFYTRTWFFIAIGAALILGALAFTLLPGRRGEPAPNRRTGSVAAVSSGGQTPPAAASEAARGSSRASDTAAAPAMSSATAAASSGGPALAPYGGTMPVLQPLAAPGGGSAFNFTVSGGGEAIDGNIVVPDNWEGDTVVIGTNAEGGRSTGRGRFQLTRNGNVPMRVMTVQWQQDGAEAGATMIGFQGQPGQPDVQLSGSIMCVMDGANGQPVGCGRVS